MSADLIIRVATIVVIVVLMIIQRRIYHGLKELKKSRGMSRTETQTIDLKRVHIEKGDILLFEADKPLSEHAIDRIRGEARAVLEHLGWTTDDVQVIVLAGSHLKLNKVLGRKE